MTDSTDSGGQSQPWWHSTPDEPPVDSALVEGMKLFSALRDWAVDSGAAAAVADLTQSAANSATEYLSHVATAVEPVHTEAAEPVVRCSDCPICAGLDALDRSNPQMAATARSALSQVTALIAGFLPPGGPAKP